MNGSFFSQIYTNGAILSIFFYFSTPFLYACVFGMGLFFFCSVRFGRGDTKDFLSQPKKVLVTLIYVICSFFSAARRTNQEAPPQLSGFWLCRSRSPSGSAELAPLKQSSPFPLRLTLRLRRPIKAEIGDPCFCLYSNPLCFINPSVASDAFPCVLYHKTQGRCVRCIFLFASAPILYVIPCNVTGHGRGGGGEVSNVN